MGRSRRGVTPSLARKVATRRPRKTVVVFCEGQRTEPEEFWCVFDVEWPTNHPHLIEASNLAEAHGFGWQSPTLASSCGWSCISGSTRHGLKTKPPYGYAAPATTAKTKGSRLRSTCHDVRPPLPAPPHSTKCTSATAALFRTTTPRPACDLLVTTVTTPLDE